MKKNLLNLLNNIKEDEEYTPDHERYMLIDGLNLFFRNFSAINEINSKGQHIGGVGGFLRSLGSLINNIQPTKVFMVFDGRGSSQNRKNILPEYKSGRNIQRITNWDIFDNLEEEDESKIDQIIRINQYLKTLPIHVLSIDKTEADDVIAYLGKTLIKNDKDKVFIVSSDKDYLQCITSQVIVYRPIEKEFYTEQTVIDKFGISPKNFILYKLLLGDSSDAVTGIKGLGEKGIRKKFPELFERDLSLDDLINISETKMNDHIVYARLLHSIDDLENKYKIMDLNNPMITKSDEEFIDNFIKTDQLEYHPKLFIEMSNDDQLGKLIRNTDIWLNSNFKHLLTK